MADQENEEAVVTLVDHRRLIQEYNHLLGILETTIRGVLWITRTGAVVGWYFWQGLYPALGLFGFICLTSGLQYSMEQVAEAKGRRQKEQEVTDAKLQEIQQKKYEAVRAQQEAARAGQMFRPAK